MTFARRWIGIAVSVGALAGCGGGETAPAQDPSAKGAGGALEAQIRSGRATLLAGVTARADKKAIMKQVSTELGVECDYCHDVADFQAPSPSKTIANYMFAHYAVAEEKRGGGVVTCGVCHAGQAKFLGDRADKDRVKGIMKAQFVDGLTLRGGKPLVCETCHGEKKDAPFLPRG
jgi:hypothetical protein